MEGRYHLNHALYGLVRLVPEGMRAQATLKDASAMSDLQKTSWQLAMDLTAGVAWAPTETLKLGNGKFGFWVFGEGGYGLATKADLLLETTDGGDIPQATSSLDFGKLGLGGALLRFGVAGTY